MKLYSDFAEVYARGQYPQYSETILKLFPRVLKRFEAKPKTLLDVACGEGTFAVGMAQRGLHVVGIDQSPDILRLARHKTHKERVQVTFVRKDMRFLDFIPQFDLVTCWYDSLNYLLRLADLKKTFMGVSRALRKDGLFVFDMNTIYGLSVRWQQYPSRVQQDAGGVFDVARPRWDKRRQVASVRITAFIRRGRLWKRVDEEHREKGYSLSQIKRCLKESGLKELACWGSIRKMNSPRVTTGRVWFVSQRKNQSGA